jgi:hypothetical protein
MATDRLRTLALRWGLVGLAAFAVVVLRFLGDFLDEWATLRSRTDWRTLSARMSQLKPYLWKAQTSGPVAVALAAALGVTVVALLVLGVRDALRGDPPDDPGPGTDG